MPRAKKDISKDLMFQKIMPSADLPGKRDEDEAEAIDNVIETTQQTDISQAQISENGPAQVAEQSPQAPVATPALNIHQPPPPNPNQPSTPAPAIATMAQQIAARTIDFSSDGEGYLVNTMEKLVFDNLETILSRFKCCKCDRCKKDILALTLNSLPPRYIVATKDKPPLPCRDPQAITEVTTALVRSVIKVKNDPRH